MIALAYLLTCIVLTDLIIAVLPRLGGLPARVAAGLAVFAAFASVVFVALTFDLAGLLVPGLVVVVAWGFVHIGAALPALAGAGAITLTVLGAIVHGPAHAPRWLVDYVDGLNVPALASTEPESFLLFIAVAAFLVRPSNTVVRRVLDAAGPRVRAEENLVRGGRFIGPLERVLIFIFALMGAHAVLTAVIAAKGILRFPEISHDDRDGVKSEYVLVGSFASWLLALAFVPLF